MLFYIGRQAVDDFHEVLLLCGNAEAYGSQKLLRAMFERVVVLKYLHANPAAIDDYLDFYWVTQHRRIANLKRFYPEERLDTEKEQEIEERFEEVKQRYRHRKCSECGHRETGLSWTPMAFADMAAEVDLGRFVPFAYTEALYQTHTNIVGLLARLEGEEPGPISYGDRINRHSADKVLCTAHAILLHVLLVQTERFKLDIDRRRLEQDFIEAWKTPEVAPPTLEQTDSGLDSKT